MPSKSNWVCFRCRLAVRRPNFSYANVPPCANCGHPSFRLGHTVPLPAKADIRGWKQLHEQMREMLHTFEENRYKQRIRERHNIEQEIVKLMSRPENRGRASAIRLLRKRLANM